MANAEQLDILKLGVHAWNQWWEENPPRKLDLRGANLCGADLSGVQLDGADLRRADLRGANLSSREAVNFSAEAPL